MALRAGAFPEKLGHSACSQPACAGKDWCITHPIGQRCTDDQPTIKGQTSANFGYSKPLFACVHRTFCDQFIASARAIFFCHRGRPGESLIWDTITGQSAVILRQHTTPFRPMIVRSMIWSLSIKSLRTLEPPHTRKFPRVNAQDSKLGPIQPWDVKDFFNGAKVAVVRPNEPTGSMPPAVSNCSLLSAGTKDNPARFTFYHAAMSRREGSPGMTMPDPNKSRRQLGQR